MMAMEQFVKNMGKFRSTGFENYCWNTIWALDFEVSRWRRGFRIFRVENIMGDIVNFEGGSDVGRTLGPPGCS